MHFTWRFGSPDSQLSRWLMIASMATAVLPVWRSPMISSRWPRPMGVMASMDLMPVCRGSFTGWRWTTDGAWTSRALVSSVSMSPLPSTGRPSGSMTRPRNWSPTGTERIRPVCLTSSPSSIWEASPRITHPIWRTSRLNAIPRMPPGNSSSSLARVEGRPSTRAMPSPVSVTRPTSSRDTPGSKPSTCLWRALLISSELMVSSATSSHPFASLREPRSRSSGQALQRQLQLPADRAVDDLVAHASDHAAHDRGIHHDLDVHPSSRGPGQRLPQPRLPRVVEGNRGASLHDHAPVPRRRPVGQVAKPLHRVAGLPRGPSSRKDRVGQGAPEGRLRLDQPGQPEQLLGHSLERALGFGLRQHRLQREVLEHLAEPVRDGVLHGKVLEEGEGPLVESPAEEVPQEPPLGIRRNADVGQGLAELRLPAQEVGEREQLLADARLRAASGRRRRRERLLRAGARREPAPRSRLAHGLPPAGDRPPPSPASGAGPTLAASSST